MSASNCCFLTFIQASQEAGKVVCYSHLFKHCIGLGSQFSLVVHAQPCPTCCNPLECSPPGSSVHGISQARMLEGVAISSSRGSSQPRDQTCVSCIFCIGRQILYHCAPWEAVPWLELFCSVHLSARTYWALILHRVLGPQNRVTSFFSGSISRALVWS